MAEDLKLQSDGGSRTAEEIRNTAEDAGQIGRDERSQEARVLDVGEADRDVGRAENVEDERDLDFERIRDSLDDFDKIINEDRNRRNRERYGSSFIGRMHSFLAGADIRGGYGVGDELARRGIKVFGKSALTAGLSAGAAAVLGGVSLPVILGVGAGALVGRAAVEGYRTIRGKERRQRQDIEKGHEAVYELIQKMGEELMEMRRSLEEKHSSEASYNVEADEEYQNKQLEIFEMLYNDSKRRVQVVRDPSPEDPRRNEEKYIALRTNETSEEGARTVGENLDQAETDLRKQEKKMEFISDMVSAATSIGGGIWGKIIAGREVAQRAAQAAVGAQNSFLRGGQAYVDINKDGISHLVQLASDQNGSLINQALYYKAQALSHAGQTLAEGVPNPDLYTAGDIINRAGEHWHSVGESLQAILNSISATELAKIGPEKAVILASQMKTLAGVGLALVSQNVVRPLYDRFARPEEKISRDKKEATGQTMAGIKLAMPDRNIPTPPPEPTPPELNFDGVLNKGAVWHPKQDVGYIYGRELGAGEEDHKKISFGKDETLITEDIVRFESGRPGWAVRIRKKSDPDKIFEVPVESFMIKINPEIFSGIKDEDELDKARHDLINYCKGYISDLVDREKSSAKPAGVSESPTGKTEPLKEVEESLVADYRNRLEEIYEKAGERTPEEVRELLAEVNAILASERQSGQGKLEESLREIDLNEMFLDKNVVFLPGVGSVIFVGDTHGDPLASRAIIEQSRFIERLGRGEPVKMVFLGDYVDRGDREIENIEQVLDLKRRFPDNIILLRGNHDEGETVNDYDFKQSVKDRYGDEGIDLWQYYVDTTKRLPLAVVSKNGIIALHGGIGEFTSLTDLNRPENEEQIIWNDPRNRISGLQPSGRGAGNEFGEDIVDSFFNKTGGKVLIRSHEYPSRVSFNGKSATIFSTGNGSQFSAYGGLARYLEMNLAEEVQLITADQLISVDYNGLEFGQKEAEDGDEITVKDKEGQEVELRPGQVWQWVDGDSKWNKTIISINRKGDKVTVEFEDRKVEKEYKYWEELFKRGSMVDLNEGGKNA